MRERREERGEGQVLYKSTMNLGLPLVATKPLFQIF